MRGHPRPGLHRPLGAPLEGVAEHRAASGAWGGHCPQHFLYFFPLPHGHGSLRPTLSLTAGATRGPRLLAMSCRSYTAHSASPKASKRAWLTLGGPF